MTVEWTFHCDGPDCNASWGESSCPGLLTVIETGDSTERHFCSWDCCMKFAATVPVPEIIPFTPLPRKSDEPY